MLAYTPSGAQVVLVVTVAILSAFAAGFALSRLSQPQDGRLVAWIVFLGGTTSVERLTAAEPPGVRMLAIVAYALVAMKSVVVVEERRRGLPRLSFGRWAAFALGWPGMQPRLFARAGTGPLPRAGTMVLRGLARAAIGLALVALARALWIGLESRLLASAALLAGLSFVLHFGAFNVLAGIWRALGIPCDALFRAPWRSQSLSEFWARRWNLAFSEMTSIVAYRPLADRLGRPRALFAGFVMSGLLHEMAISLPVMEGFGMPLFYFVLHGGLVLVERERAAAGRPLTGWSGRAWTLMWVLAPLPLLFHRPFLAGVMWPLIGIPGGD